MQTCAHSHEGYNSLETSVTKQIRKADIVERTHTHTIIHMVDKAQLVAENLVLERLGALHYGQCR